MEKKLDLSKLNFKEGKVSTEYNDVNFEEYCPNSSSSFGVLFYAVVKKNGEEKAVLVELLTEEFDPRDVIEVDYEYEPSNMVPYGSTMVEESPAGYSVRGYKISNAIDMSDDYSFFGGKFFTESLTEKEALDFLGITKEEFSGVYKRFSKVLKDNKLLPGLLKDYIGKDSDRLPEREDSEPDYDF